MREIFRLSAALGILRHQVHKELPLQHIALLLAVSENPGITMPELMKMLDMPQGSLSRNVKALSRYVEREHDVPVLKGYDLLRTERDPQHPRVLAVYLTGHGEALIRELARTLRPRHHEESLPGFGRRPFDTVMPGSREAVAQ
ncbi:MAG: winged helix-turn-helix transcriptional regulator [Desulfuromonas sp.]|nr:winged helix-turn-helix transcriptional regulator [Desulfuromonas sp.]